MATITKTPAAVSSSGSSPLVSTASVPPGTTQTPVSGTANTGIFDYLAMSPLVIGTVLFLTLTLALFWAFRSGKIGPLARGSCLALAAILSLGISELLVCFLTGATAFATVFAIVYMIIGTSLTIYLWKSGGMSQRIGLLIAGTSAIAGFAFVAPIMPTEFTSLVTLTLGRQTLTAALLAIAFVFALTFIFGRMFCAHICPVGSIQELVYGVVPGRKIVMEKSRALEISRFVIFLVTIAAALYGFNFMAFTGLYEFFTLTVSGVFFIGAALVILSIFLYRPICRVLCPFGVIFSVLAHFGVGNLIRKKDCISCRKCESVCPVPVPVTGENDSKRECYLCGRCAESCPKDVIQLSSNREAISTLE
ncbi:MAG: 4Fe-4S binding protein [Methanoregulaceae archaeon]